MTMMTLKISVTAGMVLIAMMAPAGTLPEEGLKAGDRIDLSIVVSETNVWPGESFDVEIRLSVGLPRGTRRLREPFSAGSPPQLIIPFLTDPPSGVEGPDVEALLRPLITLDTSLPALKINRFGVETHQAPRGVRLTPSLDREIPAARFLLNRQWRHDHDRDWLDYRLRSRWHAGTQGVFAFGPVTFSGQVAVAFDEAGNIARWRHGAATSGVVIVTSALPPPEHIPELFFGAIGSTMTADATLAPQTCRVGDPLELVVRIGGDVSLDPLRPPRLGDDEMVSRGFRVHDATAQTVRGIDRVEFRYGVRPLKEGVVAFPALQLPWFDRHRQSFTNALTQPVPLYVSPAPRVPFRDAAWMPAGFRDHAGGWQRITWRDEHKALGLAGWGAALYLGVRFLAGLAARGRAWHREYRRRGAHRALRRRLRRLTPEMAVVPQVYARAVRAACNRFFSDRFDVDVTAKTPSELWQTLARYGSQTMPSPAARDILERCYHQCFTDQTRLLFDPATDIPRLAQALTVLPAGSLTQAALPQPKRSTAILTPDSRSAAPCARSAGFFLRRAIAPLIAGVVIIVWLFATQTAKPPPADVPIRKHIWEEANALAANAQTHTDRVAARERYRELLDAGARHPALYYNYGTLCLKTGKRYAAVNALQRAAIMEKLQDDLKHNLSLAWRQGTPVTESQPVGDRVARAAFMLAARSSLAGLMRFAGWWMLIVWLILALRVAGGGHLPTFPSRKGVAQ